MTLFRWLFVGTGNCVSDPFSYVEGNGAEMSSGQDWSSLL